MDGEGKLKTGTELEGSSVSFTKEPTNSLELAGGTGQSMPKGCFSFGKETSPF